MKLLLLRHGESEWNAAGRWQGWGDPPLSQRGRDQAAAAARALPAFDAVYSSDLRRARETAEIIAGGRIETDVDLREIDVGEWTGLTDAEIEQRGPGQLQAWRSLELQQPPGGEHRDQLRTRVLRAVDRIASKHPSGTVLVVTHGGAIHAVERHLGLVETGRMGNVGGRWFEAASPLRACGPRVLLAD